VEAKVHGIEGKESRWETLIFYGFDVYPSWQGMFFVLELPFKCILSHLFKITSDVP
jgi:hypothetical protein